MIEYDDYKRQAHTHVHTHINQSVLQAQEVIYLLILLYLQYDINGEQSINDRLYLMKGLLCITY